MAPRGVVTMQPPLPVRGKRRRRWDGRARGSPPPGALVPLLLHAYENGLGGFVRRRCRTRDDAEDALQETMLAALRSSGSFRGESRFGTWLHAVAVNACRRSYRRGLYDPHLTDVVPLDAASPTVVFTGRSHDLASSPATPEQQLLRAELAARIADAMARLPEHYRTVVLLRDGDGWSSHATAAALCLSGPAMKSRLRARMFLRRALAGYLEP